MILQCAGKGAVQGAVSLTVIQNTKDRVGLSRADPLYFSIL